MAETSQTHKNNPETSKKQPNLLLDLPRDILNEILIKIAWEDYGSLYTLSGTCRDLRRECKKFIDKHPQHLFRKTKFRPAGMSESDCSDNDYNDDNDSDDWSHDLNDDHYDDFIEDLMDRISFGSNCDSDLLEEWRRHKGEADTSDDEDEFAEANENEKKDDTKAAGDRRDGADLDPAAATEEELW